MNWYEFHSPSPHTTHTHMHPDARSVMHYFYFISVMYQNCFLLFKSILGRIMSLTFGSSQERRCVFPPPLLFPPPIFRAALSLSPSVAVAGERVGWVNPILHDILFFLTHSFAISRKRWVHSLSIMSMKLFVLAFRLKGKNKINRVKFHFFYNNICWIKARL